MTFRAASPSAPLPDKSRLTGFLDLPLELRIMIYTEISVDPDNSYIIDRNIHKEDCQSSWPPIQR